MEESETPLLNWQPPQSFGGQTYNPSKDKRRLKVQYHRVFSLMSDGVWRSLEDIANLTGFPQASISARLRDMRKTANGRHLVERKRLQQGLFQYRLSLNRLLDIKP